MTQQFFRPTVQEILKFFRKNSPSLKAGAILTLQLQEEDISKIGYKAFTDLAQLFFMRLKTPRYDTKGQYISLDFEKLNTENSFHKLQQDKEKYGKESPFFSLDKTAQFSFLYAYEEALKFVAIQDRKRIFNAGINKGDEFRVIKELIGIENFVKQEYVGVDYSKSAIEYATESFQEKNIRFIAHDLNDLESLELGRFDLFISIGTLQSSGINFNQKFMEIYQNYLHKDAAAILGFPNCRWIDGEMIYGAKAPNYSFSEMSLVLKDIHFCKKYLQQKGYRVVVTGKEYLFLSARKLS